MHRSLGASSAITVGLLLCVTACRSARSTEPKQTAPEQRPDAQTEPDKTEPDDTEPAETEPDKTEPDKTEPDETEPDKTEPEPVPAAPEPTTLSYLPLGINLSAVNYYATYYPFDNLFQSRDSWASRDGTTWDTLMAANIPMGADGYPLALPYQGQMLRAAAFLPLRGGTFELTWQGEGSLSVQGPDRMQLEVGAHSVRFKVAQSSIDAVFVTIERSDSANHVHDIQVHDDGSYKEAFRKSLQGFSLLRFMDWGAINNSPVATWTDRPTPARAQGTERGVAIETMIDTANALHADMWFNIPHRADDEYVERAARMIAERLDPKRKVYVEYSNENWNGIFSQVQWEQQQGMAAGLGALQTYEKEGDAVFWAGLNYSVRRAAAAHSIFRDVLGNARVVAVLAGQSANAGLNADLLSAYADPRVNLVGGHPDALAVAPYFGTVYTTTDNAAALTVDRILQDAEASIAERIALDTKNNRAVADEHGVALIAYEAGQHILAVGGLENDAALVERITRANRHPRMGALYRKAHRAWVTNGGGIAAYFASCQAPGKFGAWGALEYQDQPRSEAPKWEALQAIMLDRQ